MEVYQAMKEKIFMNQTAEDFLVLNYDDELTRGMKDRAKSQVCYFSGKEELAEGAFIQDGLLVLKWGGKTYELVSVKELGIKGAHNVLNALAAAAVTARYVYAAKREFGGASGDLAGWFLQKAEFWALAALALAQYWEAKA